MTWRAFSSEVLASIVVFLVALPLCMGIAIASGVPPAMGLVSGIIGGIVVGLLAGAPLQVSGPAAGLAVIVFDIVHTHGLEAVGPILFLAGLVQMAAGRARVGQWFRAVAPAVIYAMLSGIGILIFASQFHVMVDDVPASNGLVNVITIPRAILKGIWPVEGTPHHLAAGIGVLTLAVLIGWNWARSRITGPIRAIPAPLLAVAAAVATAAAFDLPIAYVSVPESIGEFIMIPTMESMALLVRPDILGTALAVAVIASAEALLCAVAVDKLHFGPRTDLDRELFAQGVGNTLAGLIGGLPVTGVIVRSSANVESGARTRWSAVLHGVWLLVAVGAAPFLLERIPIAALAAVLVYIGWRLVDLRVMRMLLERGRSELAIYAVTVVAIVMTNLLEGLLVGVALSVLKLVWSFSRLEVEVVEGEANRVDVHLRGSGTFVGLPALASALSGIAEGAAVHVHLESVDYVDHACFELISDWRRQHEERGGSVILAWDVLEERGVYKVRRDLA